MVCTVSAGTSAAYYLSEQARYYTAGTEAVGRWYAPSSALGVANAAEIDDKIFERLHSGCDETGRPLTQNADGTHANRVAGYDLTFSAPKSVSVLWALAQGDRRDALAVAHDEAVREALAMINDNAAFTRRGKGGERLEAVHLTGAVFRHGEARPTGESTEAVEADPQLHSHAVIFNLARREDGSWGSIDGRQLYRWKMAAGAVYRAELASRLQALGYNVVRTDEKGLFEVDGVPEAVRDHFSGRRREIVAALKEMGLDSAAAPALAAATTLAGRRSKPMSFNRDPHARWVERANALGYRPEPPAREHLSNEFHFNPAEVLASLTETQAIFRRQNVMAAVAAALTGSGSRAETVLTRVVEVLASAEVVSLGIDSLGQQVFSTREMMVLEQEVIGHAKAMAAAQFSTIHADRLFPALGQEQNAAIVEALKPQCLSVIEGAAGSGKTTTLGAIAKICHANGVRVIGAATAWRAAKQLGEECGMESRALDSWLAKHRDGHRVFDERTVLIVDEAGLLSTRQMHELLSAARASRTKVILAGDRRQLQAIGAGSGLALVANEVAATRMDSNRRQNEAWARQAVSQLSRGQAAAALEAFYRNGCLNWAAGWQEVQKTVIQLWHEQIDRHGGQGPLVIAKSNTDVRALNTALRNEMRARGKLSGAEVTVRATDRSRTTVNLTIARGERIEFTTRNDALGVINGTIGIVTRVDQEVDGQARLAVAIGSRSVSFSTADIADKKGRARIGHAYATTLYNSQGVTVDRAIIVGTSTMTANQAYVALSRAKDRSDIIIDSKVVDSELRAMDRASGQLRTSPIAVDDRRQHIANRWARQEVKETAIRTKLPELRHSTSIRALALDP